MNAQPESSDRPSENTEGVPPDSSSDVYGTCQTVFAQANVDVPKTYDSEKIGVLFVCNTGLSVRLFEGALEAPDAHGVVLLAASAIGGLISVVAVVGLPRTITRTKSPRAPMSSLTAALLLQLLLLFVLV